MMATSTSKGVGVAAGTVCAVFAAFVLIHLVWAVGVTWELDEVTGGQGQNDARIALTFSSLVGAAAGAAALIVTLGRVGWLKTRLSDRMLHIGASVVFARARDRDPEPDEHLGPADSRAAAGDRRAPGRTGAPTAARG